VEVRIYVTQPGLVVLAFNVEGGDQFKTLLGNSFWHNGRYNRIFSPL
jgi:hypothetical protein